MKDVKLEVAGAGRFWYIARVKVAAGGKRMAKQCRLFDTFTTREAAEKQLAGYEEQRAAERV